MNQQEILDERTLMRRAASKKSGTMPIPGAEGAARRDVSRAGFRRKGPIQNPKVEKSGTDVPVWVRTHKSPAEYAAHTAKKQHKEGDKTDVKSLRKQLHKTGATKSSEVHDITVGSPKSKVKDPGQRARQFVGALKSVAGEMRKRKGVATNTPTAISSSGKKRKRSDEEGAEQRGRIYKKLGMGERDPKTGVQMAKLGEGKTFTQFMIEASATQQLKLRAAQLIAKHRDNPEKSEIYKNLLSKVRERESPADIDYPDRESARRDKRLYPSHRMSSHPNEDNPSTETKDPKKRRKQKALKEID